MKYHDFLTTKNELYFLFNFFKKKNKTNYLPTDLIHSFNFKILKKKSINDKKRNYFYAFKILFCTLIQNKSFKTSLVRQRYQFKFLSLLFYSFRESSLPMRKNYSFVYRRKFIHTCYSIGFQTGGSGFDSRCRQRQTECMRYTSS